jgi:hypothetical protein
MNGLESIGKHFSFKCSKVQETQLSSSIKKNNLSQQCPILLLLWILCRCLFASCKMKHHISLLVYDNTTHLINSHTNVHLLTQLWINLDRKEICLMICFACSSFWNCIIENDTGDYLCCNITNLLSKEWINFIFFLFVFWSEMKTFIFSKHKVIRNWKIVVNIKYTECYFWKGQEIMLFSLVVRTRKIITSFWSSLWFFHLIPWCIMNVSL